MSTVSDAIQYALQERMAPTIQESMWETDPVYPMITQTSAGVQRNQVGRGWTLYKTYVAGGAGGGKYEAVTGQNVMTGPDNFTAYDTPQAYQAYDETVAPALIRANVSLIQYKGNLFLPDTIMRADALSASIGSMVALNMKALGQSMAQYDAAVFYAADTTNYALFGISNSGTDVANASGDTTSVDIDFSGGFDATVGGRIHRARPGMLVDQWDDTGLIKRNTNFYLAIDNVDPVDGKVRICRIDGGTYQTDTVLGGGVDMAGDCDGDFFTIKDSKGQAPHGLNSWIADGSTITTFYGVTVADHGQFKSYVPSAISAALTEGDLNKYFGAFYSMFPGRGLPDAITTMGVLMGFIDNLDMAAGVGTAVDGTYRYNRQGQAMQANMGWEYFKYRFGSKVTNFYTSDYMEGGDLVAGKIANGGIVRHVPPTLPGSKSDSRFGQEIEFVAPIGGSGYQGIFKHAHNASGATTGMVEAPHLRQWNYMPDCPNWLKLHTITELY